MLARCYKAELSKLLKGKGIYIALAVMIVIVLFYSILSSVLFGSLDMSGMMEDNFLDIIASTPREDYPELIATLRSQLEMLEDDKEGMISRFVDPKGYYKARIAILEFFVAHEDVKIDDVMLPSTGMFAMAENSLNFMTNTILLILEISTVYAAILMAGVLAGEYRDGTLKMQLMRANSRRSILTAKWLAVFTISLGLMFVGIVVAAIYAAIHFKTKVSDVLIVLGNSNVSVIPSGLYVFIAILCAILALFAMIQFSSFMCGISRYNRSVAMAIPIVVVMLGTLSSMLLQVMYLGVIDFPYCLNLMTFLTPSETRLPNTSFYTALPVLLVYIGIFTTISYWSFDRTEL